MTVIGEAFIAIRGDTKEFASNIGSEVSRIARHAAELFAGAFVVEKGFEFVKQGAEQLGELQKTLAQTTAAIKSTGGAAGVTSDQILALAKSQQAATGVSKEQILQGEKTLLLFTNIRNQVGKNNDVFTQATKITEDLSVRLGVDMASAAKLVGKALEDPEKGTTALRRAGIVLTEQQKEQIKAFVASGDVLGAQKLVLGDLTKVVGGAAAAFGDTLPGQLAKMKNSFNEVKEDVARALLPALNALLPALNALLPVIGTALAGAAEALAPPLTQLTTALGPVLTQVVKALAPVVSAVATALVQVLVSLLPLLPPLSQLLLALVPLIPPLATLVATLISGLVPALVPVITGVTNLAIALVGPLATAVTAVTNFIKPMLQVIAQIGEFVGRVITAFAHFVSNAPLFGKAGAAAVDIVFGALDRLQKIIGGIIGFFERLGAKASDIANAIKRAFDKIISVIPSWLIPHSPTDLEIGLLGIAKAFEEVARAGARFALPNLPTVPELAALGPGGGTTNITVNEAVDPRATAEAVAARLVQIR